MKERRRERIILRHVINNTLHHLSKKYFNFNKSPASSVSHISSYRVTSNAFRCPHRKD